MITVADEEQKRLAALTRRFVVKRVKRRSYAASVDNMVARDFIAAGVEVAVVDDFSFVVQRFDNRSAGIVYQ